MKNEKVHMQALHRHLDVVLVQILPYNCSETNYSFREDSPSSRTPLSTWMLVSPSDPPLFFRPAALCSVDMYSPVGLPKRHLWRSIG